MEPLKGEPCENGSQVRELLGPLNPTFHHIGIAVKSIEKACSFFCDGLGMTVLPGPSGKIGEIVTDKLQGVKLVMLQSGSSMVELVEPFHDGEKETPVQRILSERDESMYHFCLEVDDLDHASKILLEQYECVLVSPAKPAPLFGMKRVSFLYSTVSNNLIELLERRSPVITDAAVVEEKEAKTTITDYITISASFTAEMLEEPLRFWLNLTGLKDTVDLRFADYNSVFQQLLNPASDFSMSGARGINVVMIRFEDLAKKSETGNSDKELIDNMLNNVTELCSAVDSYFSSNQSTPLLILECKPSPDFQNKFSNHLSLAEKELSAKVQQLLIKEGAAVNMISWRELENLYPVNDGYYSAASDRMAHVPYNDSYYTSLATIIVRKFWVEQHRGEFKVFVADCDNTLWGGIVSEDGIPQVTIDGEYRYLQQRLLDQKDAGRLLCLCSMNDEPDVVNTFDQRTDDMVLRNDDITSMKVNWNPKVNNIADLADELKLGLDSFIFFDDDHVNVESVSTGLPSVLSIRMVEDHEASLRRLKNLWVLDTPISISQEDKKRTQMYKENSNRESFRKAKRMSFPDFIASLELQIRIQTLEPKYNARVAQMTQRTNRFNTTTIRMSEAQLEQWLNTNDRRGCFVVDVSDRFGSYGLAAASLYEMEDDSLVVVDLMMSCRVLNRGVEYKLLAELGNMALHESKPTVKVSFAKSAKNTPVLEFLRKISELFEGIVSAEEDSFMFPSMLLSKLSYDEIIKNSADTNPDTPSPSKTTSEKPMKTEFGQRNALLKYISEKLNSVEAITEEMSKQQTASSIENENDCLNVLRGEVEKLIGKEMDGKEETPLMSLGLNSLKSVQLVASLRAQFESISDEIPSTLVFDYPTLRQMKSFLEKKLSEYPNQDESDSLPTQHVNKVKTLSMMELKTFLCKEAGRIIGKDMSGFLGTPLMSAGMSSINSVRFFAAIAKRFPDNADDLPATLVFDYPTINHIATFIAGKLEIEAKVESPVVSSSIISHPISSKKESEIAVVSMACRFPGGINNPEEYWSYLMSKKEARARIPKDRWDMNTVYPDDCGEEVRYMYPVDDIKTFDAQFFNIPAIEALSMDPQQRFILTLAYEALYRSKLHGPDATPETEGIARFSNANIGIFVGMCNYDWAYLRLEDPGSHSSYTFSARAAAIAPGRVSYTLNLKGPSVVYDTACSSSHVALEAACAAIKRGACDAAVVIGCSLNTHPETYIQLQRAGQLSPSGRCNTFDASADGYARGEGCGAIVLRRTDDPSFLTEKEESLAIINNVSINQDGQSASLTAPNGPSQQIVIRRGLKTAGLEPKDIQFVETHGTGTMLGDAIEVNSLKEVFGGERDNPLAIGAVKTSIGHLEAASGIAGMIKAIMVLQHGMAPPNLNLSKLNPNISTKRFHAHFPADAFNLQKGTSEHMYVGVNSFGMGGTNAFAIMQQSGQSSIKASKRNRYCLTAVPPPVNPKEFAWKTPIPYKHRFYNVDTIERCGLPPRSCMPSEARASVESKPAGQAVGQPSKQLIKIMSAGDAELIEQLVTNLVQEAVSQINPSGGSVGLDENIQDLGFDSLAVIELANILEKNIPELSPPHMPAASNFLIELSTVRKMIDRIINVIGSFETKTKKEDRKYVVFQEVQDALSAVNLTGEPVGENDILANLGLDSLAAVELGNILLKKFPGVTSLPQPSCLLTELPTVVSLVDYICNSEAEIKSKSLAKALSKNNNERLQMVIDLVQEAVALVNLTGEAVDADEKLANLGIDSLAAIELCNMLKQKFPELNPSSMPVPSALVNELPTVQSISEHIFELLNQYETEVKTDEKVPMGLSMKENGSPLIAFLFTGQGSQYADMGLSLYERERVFRESMDTCSKILKEGGYLEESLISVIYGNKSGLINETEYTQPALFAVEYSLAMLWYSRGFKPDVVSGHSVGEYVAATLAGVFSLEDGLRLIAARGKAIGDCDPQNGVMVAVRASEQILEQAIRSAALSHKCVRNRVAIAAVNGPKSCVLAGEDKFVNIVIDCLPDGVGTSRLTVSHAFHSPLVQDALIPFRKVLSDIELQRPKLPIVSNLTGGLIDYEIATEQHWEDHLPGCVHWYSGAKCLLDEGVTVFLEVGAHPTLTKMGMQIALSVLGKENSKCLSWIPSLHRKKDSLKIFDDAHENLRNCGMDFDVETTSEGSFNYSSGSTSASTQQSESKSLDTDLSEVEAKLCNIMSEMLGGNIGKDDDLIELGLDSLGAIEIDGLMRSEFGIELPKELLFGEKLAVSTIISHMSLTYGLTETKEIPTLSGQSERKAPEAKISNEDFMNLRLPDSVEADLLLMPSIDTDRNQRVEKKLDMMASKLLNPTSLMERLEERLLTRLLDRWGNEDKIGRNSDLLSSLNQQVSHDEYVVSSNVPAKTISVELLPESKGHVLMLDGGNSPRSKTELISFLQKNNGYILSELSKRGGLLIRNCGLKNEYDFRDILNLIQNVDKNATTRDYRDGISPRTKVLDGIFTSTEYSANHDMAVHNEMSYNPHPPSKIAFFCETPPAPGTGRTPIASSEEILRKLPADMVNRFKSTGLRYIVNASSKGKGPGVPWQTMYESSDPAEVDSVCRDMKVKTKWNEDGSLTTYRSASAVRNHPVTDVEVWFNHSHLFHPTDLPVNTQKALKRMHSTYETYPKYCLFDDGTEIPSQYLDEIRKVQKECSMSWDWQKGDLLLLDNYLMCHGRSSFDSKSQPKRRVLASMLF